MDTKYFDLFIKYKDSVEETLWSRALTWFELTNYLLMFNKLNQVDIKIFGKSRIEWIRYE